MAQQQCSPHGISNDFKRREPCAAQLVESHVTRTALAIIHSAVRGYAPSRALGLQQGRWQQQKVWRDALVLRLSLLMGL